MAEDSDLRTKSIRTSAKASAAFDEVAKGFVSQGAAFEAVIASYWLEAGKERYPGYSGSIEAFNTHVARLQEIYAESLQAGKDMQEAERLASAKQAASMQATIDALGKQLEEERRLREAAQSELSAAKAEAERLQGVEAMLQMYRLEMQGLIKDAVAEGIGESAKQAQPKPRRGKAASEAADSSQMQLGGDDGRQTEI